MASSFTGDDLVRLENIEIQINKIQIAISNMASAQQVRQIAVLKQKTIDDLETRIASLESEVAILQQNS